MSVLDLEDHSDDVVSNWAEVIHANGRANDCDSLDSLASELFVLSCVELSKVSNKEVDSFLEVWREFLTNFLDDCAKGC